MSSKPRKAFDGVGRPAGIIDDVIRPIIQKGAHNISRAASRLEDRMLYKRGRGYTQDMIKIVKKKTSPTSDMAFRVANAKHHEIMLQQGRKAGRQSWSKPKTVRKAAQIARTKKY